jgi:hypothetical protein
MPSRERDPHDERQQTLVHLPRQTGEESIRGGHEAWRSVAHAGRYRVRPASVVVSVGSKRGTSVASPLHPVGADLRTAIGISDVIVAIRS